MFLAPCGHPSIQRYLTSFIAKFGEILQALTCLFAVALAAPTRREATSCSDAPKRGRCRKIVGCVWEGNNKNGECIAQACSDVAKRGQCKKMGCLWTGNKRDGACDDEPAATTEEPATTEETTDAPTTDAPTTAAPTTDAPTTDAPTPPPTDAPTPPPTDAPTSPVP
jgi:hypothetical protein